MTVPEPWRRCFLGTSRKIYTEYIRDTLAKFLFKGGVISVIRREDLSSETEPHVRRRVAIRHKETITLEKPVYVGELPIELRKKIGTHQINPIYITEIKDVQIVGPDALPLDQNGKILLEGVEGSSIRAMDANLRAILDETLPVRGRTHSEYDLGVSLAGPWSDQFFHWFVEYLPRLLIVEDYANRNSLDPLYFIPGDPPKWLTRSLELLGIPDSRVVSWNGGRAQINNFLLPSLRRHTESTAPPEGYVHSPRGIREVSKRLRERVSQDAVRENVGKRLFVSRSDAPTRHVVNEKALEPIFEDYRFDVVQPEHWSLDEQIATFANAEVVAGPHGGGLTNAIYASDPAIMEIFGKNTNPCYFGLFKGCGWDYGLVNGKAVSSDIRVEPNSFRQLCERILD